MNRLKSIRLGFIGLRNNGMNHLRRALKLPGVTVTALADKNAERLDAACSLVNGEIARHTSADTLLVSHGVDAVVLSVPNIFHAPMAMTAMRQGKSVLVEKPMAMTPAEAIEMIEVRNKTRCLLMVGMNQRFDPRHVTAHKMLREGAIGSVINCRTRFLLDRPLDGLWERGDWFLSKNLSGGGPLLDLGIHRLDLALYLMGQPPIKNVTGFVSRGLGRVVAASRGKTYELEDYAMGFFRLASGALMVLEASYFMNIPVKAQDTIIAGTNGCLIIGDQVTITQWKGNTPQTTELAPDELTATSCIEHFCRVLRKEEDLIPTPEQGLITLKLIDAIYRSAETGFSVAV